jgi:hypothetical protein
MKINAQPPKISDQIVSRRMSFFPKRAKLCYQYISFGEFANSTPVIDIAAKDHY